MKAAFFDLDGTLIHGDTQAMEAAFLIKQNRPSPGYIWAIVKTLAAALLNRAGWMSVVRQNEIYLTSYKGFTRHQLTRQAHSLFDTLICDRFLFKSVERLESHRRQGDLIVLVSATTHHLLQPVEKLLKPNHVFCTELEFDGQGRATGRALSSVCAQEKKREMVEKFARKRQIDLTRSFAYSDHHSDIPFLSCVGHPRVVNPTKELMTFARKQGWPVYQFGEDGPIKKVNLGR